MLELIEESNSQIFYELVQFYEEEFSAITLKKKNKDGKYSIDVDWKIPNIGYYWREQEKIIGFIIKQTIGEYFDIGEFYVIPSYRKRGFGKKMAFSIFDANLGKWQVRQIEGADIAKSFWRNIIKEYTKGNYTELTLEDSVWGKVTCQRFKTL